MSDGNKNVIDSNADCSVRQIGFQIEHHEIQSCIPVIFPTWVTLASEYSNLQLSM